MQTKSYFSPDNLWQMIQHFFFPPYQKTLVTPSSNGLLKRVKLRVSNLPERSPTSVNNILGFFFPNICPQIWPIEKVWGFFSPSAAVINNAAASVWVSPSDWFLKILLLFGLVLWNCCSCFTEESADGSIRTRQNHQSPIISPTCGHVEGRKMCFVFVFFFFFNKWNRKNERLMFK